jgi:Na+-transporting NADH:ubiquinone oxidoreductase subunit NqrC
MIFLISSISSSGAGFGRMINGFIGLARFSRTVDGNFWYPHTQRPWMLVGV